MGARLGQHFLMHPRIAERIVQVAGVSTEDTVLEIGPGKGMLTRALLRRALAVIAIEADQNLFEKLKIDFAEEIQNGQLELMYGDIRTYSLSKPIGQNKEYKVVANIPYYVTGEILRKFLSAEQQPSSMTLLVQKEVAERIARSNPDAKRSGPRPKRRGKESILSLSVKAYGTPHYEFTVPRGAFVPAPKVDSAVLSIRDISRSRFQDGATEKRFFELVRAGFAHKRKLLASNLKEAGLELPVSSLQSLASSRAEDLSLADWLALIH